MENEKNCWTICSECQGTGKKNRKFKKRTQHHAKPELNQDPRAKADNKTAPRQNLHLYECPNCAGSGLIPTDHFPIPNKDNYPHLAIIGGGIGGVALAVACLHRGISFTLYERDLGFDARSQGYGLTLQQASLAIKGLGIWSLKEGVHSTRHVVHTSEGKIIGEWGHRTRMHLVPKRSPKRTNIHIARQTLRLALLNQLGGQASVQWGHQLIDLKEKGNDGIELTFQVKGELRTAKADLVVGADGIRSMVRNIMLGEDKSPLRYLGCIVILGICPLSALNGLENPLLDSATVFQTANGNDRIYIMPYSKDTVMWQLSFPMTEKEASELSLKGPQALKQEAGRRTQWHVPIPQIISATPENLISGYPVYDRELLKPELLENFGKVTLIGDAAHPMSPFKGQGANQALLDALALARGITQGCGSSSNWKEVGIRKSVLADFEVKMLERSAVKVKDSAEAVRHLHSESVLFERNGPRGKGIKKNDA